MSAEELTAQLACLKSELQQKDKQLEVLKNVAEEAQAEWETAQGLEERVHAQEKALEQADLKGELDKLYALEALRAEHQQTLGRDEEQKLEEAERCEALVEDLKASHALEKAHLLEWKSDMEEVSGSVSPMTRGSSVIEHGIIREADPVQKGGTSECDDLLPAFGHELGSASDDPSHLLVPLKLAIPCQSILAWLQTCLC